MEWASHRQRYLDTKLWERKLALSIVLKILEILGNDQMEPEIFQNKILEFWVYVMRLPLANVLEKRSTEKFYSICPWIQFLLHKLIKLCYFTLHGKLMNGTGLFSSRLRLIKKHCSIRHLNFLKFQTRMFGCSKIIVSRAS